jgi:hypothetical protein
MSFEKQFNVTNNNNNKSVSFILDKYILIDIINIHVMILTWKMQKKRKNE